MALSSHALASAALVAGLSVHATDSSAMSSTAETPTHRLQLPDGRTLAWSEWGDPQGHPVLFFHGGSDSRLEGALIHDAAQAAGARIIAPDRPGFGASDPQPNRTFADWPHDVHALLDHLELPRVSVVGHSGGGPHVLALAADPRGRVHRAVVVSGAAPRQAPTKGMGFPFRMNRRFSLSFPWLSRRLLASHRTDVYERPEAYLRKWGRYFPPEGRLFQEHPETGTAIVADMREGYRQGIDAAHHESGLYYSDWGFDLENIVVPVAFVYGGEDAQAPVGWGEYLHARVPGSELTVIDGEGHISVLVRAADTILAKARPS